MSFFSKLRNGGISLFEGATGFAVDSLRAVRKIGDGEISDAAEIIVESVQEDLMGGVMGGLMGADGVGGALIGALPEAVRAPGREILNPVFEGWEYVIQETVDRPLGTIATVISAGLHDGPKAFMEIDTYARAWEINDKRTFGQSVIAAAWHIDPFDDEEYNSIQDDPLFNLLSGVLDFGQEFLDPVSIVGGTGLKVARGQLVTTKYGRTFSSGKGVMSPKGSLAPKTVLGGGVGIRPETIMNKRRGWLTKSDAQIDAADAIKQTYLSARTEAIIASPKWRRGNDLVNKADAGAGRHLSTAKKAAILRNNLGATGRSLSDEALVLIANGKTTAARNNTLRWLSSDFRVMEEWQAAAKIVRDGLVGNKSKNVYQAGVRGSQEFQDAINNFDWALLDVFESTLITTQRERYVLKPNGKYDRGNNGFSATLGQLDPSTAIAALDDLLGQVDDGLNSIRASTGGISVREMPNGTRLQEVMRQHRLESKRTKKSQYSEYVNPNTVAGRSRVMRFVTEYMPHTHMFLHSDNAIEQFRRVLTQASRVDGAMDDIANPALWVEEQVAKFTESHMAQDVDAMTRTYKGAVQRVMINIDDAHPNLDPYGRKLADTVKEAGAEWKEKWTEDKLVGITNEEGMIDASLLVDKSVEQTMFVQFGFSPSQAQTSFVLPRFDNVQRTIELAGKGRIDHGRRALGRGLSDKLATTHSIWRSSVLLTPKWPMRVAIDEQLRVASYLGATTMLSNFAGGFENMRRAHSVHNLEGWSEVGKIERLVDEMQARTPARSVEVLSKAELNDLHAELIGIEIRLEAQLTDHKMGNRKRRQVKDLSPEERKARYRLHAAKANANKAILDNDIALERIRQMEVPRDDFVEMWEEAGPEAFDESVAAVQKELVNTGRNKAKAIRTAGLKFIAVSLIVGNPVIGASYGMVAAMSKRRRIREATTRRTAGAWATASRQQGRELLLEAQSPSEIAAARSIMSDADYVQKLVDDDVAGAEKIKFAFDMADELMEEAGMPSLMIGGTAFRNSFGDDQRYQNQILAEASANQSMGVLWSSAAGHAEKELARLSRNERIIYDYLKGNPDVDFGVAYDSMINLYTSNSLKDSFYQIVWGKGSYDDRVNALSRMLSEDPVFRDTLLKRTHYSDTKAGNVGYGDLTRTDLDNVAKAIVLEYENVLPSDWFPKTRSRARSGTFAWTDVQSEMLDIHGPAAQATLNNNFATLDLPKFHDDLVYREEQIIKFIRSQDGSKVKKFVDETIEETVSVDTTVTVGTKGGFENKGKGSAAGDGKDKAMREVADSAIVEVDPTRKRASSSQTTLNELGSPSPEAKVIMLARNGSLKGQPLGANATTAIDGAIKNNPDVVFVVGDMPGVDTPFIDYLESKGASYTVYHTGDKPRVKVQSGEKKGTPKETQVLTDIQREIGTETIPSTKNFGTAHAPQQITTDGERGLINWTKEQARSAFTMLGELPSDNLARHPFFASVYEKEMRRATYSMMDADGNIKISQNAIDKIEANARQEALRETKKLLYDLAEGSRMGEYLANISPFLNAWQEVIGRWSGIAVDNPFFVGNAMRLYKKPWEAETLGLSEITTDDGSTYFVFRLFGEGYDEAGASTTIFDAIPESVRSWLIPEALRDSDAPLRFSKDGLNTVLQGSPGVGPLVTVPVREIVLGSPELEEAVEFLFPFGQPKGGFIERLIQANAPSYAKNVQSLFTNTHTREALQARMMRDIIVQQAASGNPFDYSDEEGWNEIYKEAERRTNAMFLLRVGFALFFPTSMTPMTPFQPLIDEYRELVNKYGNRLGESRFLDAHGEDYFALTASMSQLNDGVSSSVEAETVFIKNRDLIQAHPVLGALVTRSLGSKSGAYAYSPAAASRQFHQRLSPGTDQTRRELLSGREIIENSDEHLGWMKYTEFMDWVRIKQDEAKLAGMSTNLNAKHMRPVARVKTKFVDELKKEHPAWATQFADIFRSERDRIELNDGMIAYLRDPTMLARDETKHIIQYYKLRMYVQRELERRYEAGGSRKLEDTNSNHDLFMFWRDKSEELGMIPNFSSIWDRYFERDNIAINTFMDHDAFAEGLFLSV